MLYSNGHKDSHGGKTLIFSLIGSAQRSCLWNFTLWKSGIYYKYNMYMWVILIRMINLPVPCVPFTKLVLYIYITTAHIAES